MVRTLFLFIRLMVQLTDWLTGWLTGLTGWKVTL